MERIKIFSLLRTFTDREFKMLGSYLNSPLFNHSRKIRLLYKSLGKFRPQFEYPELIKKKVFSVIYKNEVYDDNKIRNLFKLMHSHIRGFLSFSRFKKNSLESELFFLKELADRVPGKIFQHELEGAFPLFKECELKDEDYFLRLYKFEDIKVKAYENDLIIVKGEEYYEHILKEIEYLTDFSLISLLKKYLKILNAKRLHSIRARDKNIEQMIDYVFKNFRNSKELAIVNVIHEFLKLYTEDVRPDTILELKELNEKNRENMTYEDYKSLYIELYNYCKRKQSEGSKEFGLMSINLMKDMLNKDIFLEKNGYMMDHTFINLASSAFRLKELEWARNFIVNFREKICPEKRESAFNFAFAMYYFFTGRNNRASRSENYGLALTYLSKVKIEYFYYYTRVKNLYLMLYYEMNDFIHAEPIIDTYKHYLKTNKELPEHLIVRYSSFINYINKLFHLRENNNMEKLTRFRQAILENKKFEYKRWFLEKLHEIEVNNNKILKKATLEHT